MHDQLLGRGGGGRPFLILTSGKYHRLHLSLFLMRVCICHNEVKKLRVSVSLLPLGISLNTFVVEVLASRVDGIF